LNNPTDTEYNWFKRRTALCVNFNTPTHSVVLLLCFCEATSPKQEDYWLYSSLYGK